MNVLNQIWDFFASVKLAIFTLCTLAVTSIIGTVVPQGEPAAYYVQNYGIKLARFIDVLDFSKMYYSWWFLGLLGLLSANLIICSIERLPRVWRLITADNGDVAAENLKKMTLSRTWTTTADQPPLSGDQCRKLLEEAGWKPAARKDRQGNLLFFSQKGRWSRLGVYFVHLSILVIFLGAIVGHFTGFKGSIMIPELNLAEKIFSSKNQSTIDLGFAIRCNSFAIDFYKNGMPKEYQSSLTVIEDGKEVFTKTIEVNSPLQYRGITFYQSSYQGYKDFIFTITDESDGDAKTFSVPFQKQFTWQDKQVRFGVVNAEALGQRVTRSKIWFKYGDSPAVSKWLDDNTTEVFDVGTGRFAVSVKQMYATGLQVAKDPGVWIVYLGCLLMLLGLYMAFFMSHKKIWLHFSEKNHSSELILAGSVNKNRFSFTSQFEKIEEHIDKNVTT
ncbi:cytochrome c biogenesis protein ResB [Desulforhopalus singaporensis]|uniref:Cytochrome c biogenesis protein n=1 Tax=Desulforhopalus singaporensis TaxID=91360 RepID=A0A1H0QN67_9BACT|nr:cytochrome c biogenesis protein ResB [Desulforhopalus singaporensis]SDP18640.1 cytochrome c biogenesis protein [Desulforhopalus singaporensis]